MIDATRDAPFILPQLVDSTMLDTARNCYQRFANAHGRGLQAPGKDVSLVAGGAFAAARNALYRAAYDGRTRPASLDEARSAFDAEWGDFTLPLGSKSPKTKARTWELVVDYANTFDPPNDKLAPAFHHVQPPFEWAFRLRLDQATLGTPYEWPRYPGTQQPFEYVGRVDSVVTAGGLVIGLDDKTTSRFVNVDTWVASLMLRAQLIGYRYVLSKLIDAKCDSYVIRQGAMRTTGVEWRESPLIPIGKALVDRWLYTTRNTLASIAAYTMLMDADFHAGGDGDVWPRALGEPCVAWNRPCAFLESCRMRDSESQLSGFEVRRWNPLDGTDLGDD